MEIIAYTRFVRMTPRKLRLVANALKKKKIEQVIGRAEFIKKTAAGPILKTIKSAVANAQNNLKLNAKDLFIKNILVEEGARYKRMDKGHGARFNRGIVTKKTSHIKVILSSLEQNLAKQNNNITKVDNKK